jgi:hypothetical protein
MRMLEMANGIPWRALTCVMRRAHGVQSQQFETKRSAIERDQFGR